MLGIYEQKCSVLPFRIHQNRAGIANRRLLYTFRAS
jgi:hypothetical protein